MENGAPFVEAVIAVELVGLVVVPVLVVVVAATVVLHALLFPTEETCQVGWMDSKIVHQGIDCKGMTWRNWNDFRRMAAFIEGGSSRVICLRFRQTMAMRRRDPELRSLLPGSRPGACTASVGEHHRDGNSVKC